MTPPRRGASTLASWTAVILRALAAAGHDAPALARRAGINPDALGPGARVPRAALDRLWVLAVEATGNPAFGLTAARFVGQTTFHALGYAVLASTTLREAFERVIRYRRLIGDVLQLALIDTGDGYRFTIDVSAHPDMPFQAVDAVAAISAQQARLLHAPRVCTPAAVWFARPAPVDATPYRRAFRAPVAFAQSQNALCFSRRDIEDLLPSGNAELARGNDEVLVRHLAGLDATRVAHRLEQALLAALPDGPPSKPALARRLGMSTRTLQRRLVAEGTSFSALLESARFTLARSYLAEGRRSVTEIAFLLGFADTSTFSRAFTRWAGCSPRTWATRHRAGR